MSHFTEVETEIRDKDCLVDALKELGYHPEVGKNLKLFGYHGDIRAETADVVIRRAEVGSASNDVGWKWDPVRKSFQLIISEFDARVHRLPVKKLQQIYATKKTLKSARAHGFNLVHRKQEGGKIRLLLRR